MTVQLTPDMDWQMIGILLLGVTQLLALVAAYYGLKADNAKVTADLAIALLTEKTDRISASTQLKSDLLGLLSVADAYVKDLTHRVEVLETGQTGQNEWTKAVRQRAHELATALQLLALKVDRLERPMLVSPPTLEG